MYSPILIETVCASPVLKCNTFNHCAGRFNDDRS